MSYANVASTYRKNAILTASPEKIVKLLYDGAIRHMECCRMAFSDPATARSGEAGESLSKAFGIIGELRSSLNTKEGGEIATNLDRLYEFTLDQLSEANQRREPEPIENGLRVMRTLKEGWDAVLPA